MSFAHLNGRVYLFWFLILAHFIGDFPLQTDLVFKIKVKYSWGVLLHSGIVTLCSFLAALPYLDNYYVVSAIILFVFIFHTIVDKLKMVIDRKTKTNPFSFIIDQVLHFTGAYLVAFVPPGINEIKPHPFIPSFITPGAQIRFAIFISALIAVTYGMLFLNFTWKIWLFPNWKPSFPRGLDRWAEYFERAIICILSAHGGYAYWVIPFVAVIRGIRIFEHGEERPIFAFDVLLGIIEAVAVGSLLKYLLYYYKYV